MHSRDMDWEYRQRDQVLWLIFQDIKLQFYMNILILHSCKIACHTAYHANFIITYDFHFHTVDDHSNKKNSCSLVGIKTRYLIANTNKRFIAEQLYEELYT